MKKGEYLIFTASVLIAMLVLTGSFRKADRKDLVRAEATLKQIFTLFDAGRDNLFNEYYPLKPGSKVTYLAGDDTVTGNRVAYLWPTSGVYSAVNALLKVTGNKKYKTMVENKILPGLSNYYDTIRKPECYQSYISAAGKSDRYYDDNVWLATDLCETYDLTGNPVYLQRSISTWKFIISGWDDQLGGGIYWCEQKKQSKNTCSNAPAAVLAFRLFKTTGDSSWFRWGLRIYNWTKENLQDTTDHLYFDNKNLSGKISRQKYTYNSGQMLQASVMLYKITGDKVYLDEAHLIAGSAISRFTEDFTTPAGKKIRLFKNTGNWFNAVLFRGYRELYEADKNEMYISIFRDNLDYLWDHTRSKENLFSKDWKGEKEDQYKWLLDQASLVEIWANLANLKID